MIDPMYWYEILMTGHQKDQRPHIVLLQVLGLPRIILILNLQELQSVIFSPHAFS